jgi:hypothetical protein
MPPSQPTDPGSCSRRDSSRERSLGLALRWSIDLLDSLGLPHLVVGGLAARAHGATRPLVDVDFYVPDRALPMIAEAAAPYLTRAPARHVDRHWDIMYAKLTYEGQPVEFGGTDSVSIRDRATGRWVPQEIRFAAGERREVFPNVIATVMPAVELIRYKRLLDREVDRQDIDELSRHDHPR